MNIKNKGVIKLLIIVFVLVYIVKSYVYDNYCINVTSSVPKGIYKLSDAKYLYRGDLVYIEIPDNAKDTIWGREYLPKHIKYLIKYIKGVPGDLIEVKNDFLYINQLRVGKIRKIDSEGLILNTNLVKYHRLSKDEYILLGSDDNSYDSRYFGVITKKEILKKAKLIIEI